MAIAAAEYEAALDAAERVYLERIGKGGAALTRVAHNGSSTSREAEFDVMSMDDLEAAIKRLKRVVNGCSRRPLYP